MRILINGEVPEGTKPQKITMTIIAKLLSTELTGKEVTEIVTTHDDDEFGNALIEFCEGALIASRVIEDATQESIDVEIFISKQDY